MHQTDLGQSVRLSLWAENGAKPKEPSGEGSAPFSASCRRSGSLASVAPSLRTSGGMLACLWINPAQRGHFYFGLTSIRPVIETPPQRH
jgi:hypothetical protein